MIDEAADWGTARSILPDRSLTSDVDASILRYPYHPMRVLTEDDVRKRLDPDRVIAAIESAFRDRYLSTVIPVRPDLHMAGGIFQTMPCYDRARNALGMKLVVVQEKPQRSEDRIQATYMLLDPQTGRPLLVVPANYFTDMRTAATSAVATKFLAHETMKVLGVFGTGRQARAHIKVLPRVRRFEQVLVCGRDAGVSREFAQQMSAETDLAVAPADARTCAAESHVLCTCTSSQTPLFDGSLLRAGVHLNLVGTFQPHAREVDSATVQRARIFVESYEGAPTQAGDLFIPIQEGVIGHTHVAGDLHELISGKKRGRTRADAITIFKSIGCALEDLATAELLIA
jgi:ornithine cyclodeaminase/alanine dehydrogenase-like protein (mu-crystallin family)